jgi:hypothetical protein
VAFLCLPVITGIYATYLLTKNTNITIEFESKHGLKLINFSRRAYVLRQSTGTSTYIHPVTERTRQGTRMFPSPYSLVTEWTRQETSLNYPILFPILLLEIKSCFAHPFVTPVLIYTVQLCY